MSLDYALGTIRNWEKRCYIPARNEPDRLNGKVEMADDTYALIWASIQIDMPRIAKNNMDEWDFRIRFLKRIGISWCSTYRDGIETDFYPDYQSIGDHLGLRTNVVKVSRRTWINKIIRRVERKIEQEIENDRQGEIANATGTEEESTA